MDRFTILPNWDFNMPYVYKGYCVVDDLRVVRDEGQGEDTFRGVIVFRSDPEIDDGPAYAQCEGFIKGHAVGLIKDPPRVTFVGSVGDPDPVFEPVEMPNTDHLPANFFDKD